MSPEERYARVALGDLTEAADPRVGGLVGTLTAVGLLRRLVADAELGDLLGPAPVHSADDLLSRADAQVSAAAAVGIRYLVPGDDEWPVSLDSLDAGPVVNRMGGAPLGLWVRGPLALSRAAHGASVVGSRSATSYGQSVAGDLSADLAQAGRPVVSGAAFGIDVAAHRAALATGGPTIAVLACGVDRAYPLAHHGLLEHIAQRGALVSELPLGASPTRARFLGRNRLIAGLTRGTVIVEAAARSGALNTANWASGLQRVVMGVPGPISSAASQGVHELLRSGRAALVTSGADVEELLAPAGEHLVVVARGAPRTRDDLDDEARKVLDAVPLIRSVAAERIASRAGLSFSRTEAALTGLLSRGLVSRSARGWCVAPRTQPVAP